MLGYDCLEINKNGHICIWACIYIYLLYFSFIIGFEKFSPGFIISFETLSPGFIIGFETLSSGFIISFKIVGNETVGSGFETVSKHHNCDL